MVDINWKPSDKALRQFGLVILIGFGVIGAILFFKGKRGVAEVMWVVSGAVAAVALILPRASLPFYWVWMGIGLVLGRISSFLVLSVIFYLIFTPIAIGMRLFGRDSLRMKKSSYPNPDSYFLDHPKMTDKTNYERLF